MSYLEKKTVKTTRSVTSKSQITGTRNLVDEDTGEKVSVVEAVSQTQDVNWHKLWITHLISALDIVGNKKMKVVNYILDNLDWNSNVLIKTQQEIAKEAGIGFNTVNTTIKMLVDKKFLKVKTGVIMLNPDIIAYGSHNKRAHLLITFEEFGDKEES